MITNFFIDQTKTFQNGIVFLACEPKQDRMTKEQARGKNDGSFKWEVHLLVGKRNQFDQLTFDNFKVGLSTETNTDPCLDIAPMTPVELVNFELGVMEKVKNDVIVGFNVWYRASQVRSIAATGSKAA